MAAPAPTSGVNQPVPASVPDTSAAKPAAAPVHPAAAVAAGAAAAAAPAPAAAAAEAATKDREKVTPPPSSQVVAHAVAGATGNVAATKKNTASITLKEIEEKVAKEANQYLERCKNDEARAIKRIDRSIERLQIERENAGKRGLILEVAPIADMQILTLQMAKLHLKGNIEWSQGIADETLKRHSGNKEKARDEILSAIQSYEKSLKNPQLAKDYPKFIAEIKEVLPILLKTVAIINKQK